LLKAITDGDIACHLLSWCKDTILYAYAKRHEKSTTSLTRNDAYCGEVCLENL